MSVGRFLNELQLSPTDRSVRGRAYFRLLATFCYEVGSKYSGIVVTVPRGYETDFASNPPLLWPLLPPVGRYGLKLL